MPLPLCSLPVCFFLYTIRFIRFCILPILKRFKIYHTTFCHCRLCETEGNNVCSPINYAQVHFFAAQLKGILGMNLGRMAIHISSIGHYTLANPDKRHLSFGQKRWHTFNIRLSKCLRCFYSQVADSKCIFLENTWTWGTTLV